MHGVVDVTTGDPRDLHYRRWRMAGNSVKNKKKYQALKRKGMSKSRAARISNSGTAGSRRGGEH
jgi:hypothetical protein